MRRFQARALPHGGFWNRTVRAVGKLMTFECGSWGPGGYGSGLAYHYVSGAGLTWLESQVEDSAGGWRVPPGTEPVWSCAYHTIPARYNLASELRQTNPLTPSISGTDLLLNGSGLKAPAAIQSGTGPWVFGAQRLDENPDAEVIGTDPDTWPYPGGMSLDGMSWFADNPNVSLDSPYWEYPVVADMAYSWYPALLPPGEFPRGVAGGCHVLMPGEPVAVYEYGAYIHAPVLGIGLPLELQIGATPRIVRAKCELGIAGGGARREHYTRPTFADPGSKTVIESGIGIGMALLGGRTRIVAGVGVTDWSVVGSAPGGTYTPGKTCVVDVTAVLQRMVDLQGQFDTFGLLPSVGVAYLGGSNKDGIRGLLGAPPSIAFDVTAQEWFVTEANYFELNWESYSLGAPVVTVELPEDELGRCVVPVGWPPMD